MRSGARAAGAYVHALHAPTQLKLLKLLLEELEIPLALAHLGVELGADGVVVCLLSHEVCGLDQRLLSLDLLVDLHYLVFVGHGGGVVLREQARRAEKSRIRCGKGCGLGKRAGSALARWLDVLVGLVGLWLSWWMDGEGDG